MIGHYITKLQERLILLSTINSVPDKRANKTAEKHSPKAKTRQTQLQEKETLNDGKRTPNGSGMFLPIP